MTEGQELLGRSVLIVEDRYLIACDTAEQVRKLGGEVLGPASNLEAAAELVRERRPDIALLDVNLDGELVFPLAEELAARSAPLVFLTGYDADVLPQVWRHHPRLSKPINPKLMKKTLLLLQDG